MKNLDKTLNEIKIVFVELGTFLWEIETNKNVKDVGSLNEMSDSLKKLLLELEKLKTLQN